MIENFKVFHAQDKKNRRDLSKLIPLDTPLSMQVELASACNFKCKYCLQGSKNLKDKNFQAGIMNMDTFVETVNQIKKFPQKLKFLSLQMRGEPFLNKNVIKMIKYAKEQDIADEISIHTNASLLNEEMNKQIVESGLDSIRLSIQGVNKEQYKDISDADIDFDNMIANIKNLYEMDRKLHIYTKILNLSMTEDDKERFMEIFAPISDSIFIETPVPTWSGADIDIEHSSTRYGNESAVVNVCPRLFFAMVVLYDGAIIACGSDWENKLPLGTISETNLVDVWNSDDFNQLRISHLKGEGRNRTLCNECYVINNCEMDNIDEHADMLLERLTSKG